MRKQLVWTLFRNDPRSVRTSGGSITYEVESNNSMVLAVVSSSTTAAAAGKRRSKNVTVVVFVVWMVVACCASSLPIASSALLRGGGGSPRASNRRRTTTDYDHETNLPSAEDEDQHDHIRRQLKKGGKMKKYDTKKYPPSEPKHKKKMPPSESRISTVDKLFDAYGTAVNMGIIDPALVTASAKNNGNNNQNQQQQTSNVLDPIAQLMTDTVSAVMSQLDLQQNSNIGIGRGKGGNGYNQKQQRRRLQIRIENEIIGNTFSETNINGLNFSPIITVDNDMHDSMHDNNNAHSDSGSVVRQNGVADFHGALQNNNNAYSVDGDVIRQNGLVNTDGNSSSTTAATEDEDKDDGGRNEGTVVLENDPAPPTATNPEDVPTEDEDGRNNNNNDNDDVDDEDDIIVIHNRIINNTFTSNTQNGLIVTPTITVQNDMSDALYDNNKATSKTGNVQRQNAVADFSNALTGNNNAYSEKGDVVRQNGIITEGGGGIDLTADALQEILDLVFSFIADLESLLPTELIEKLFGAVVNELEHLIGLGNSLLEFSRNDADVFDALTNIQSDITSDDAVLVLDKLLQFLDEGIVIDIDDCSTSKEEIVSELFDPLVVYLTALLNRDDNETAKEDIEVAVVIGRKDDNDGNNSNNNNNNNSNKTNIQNNNNNVRRRVEKYQLRRRNSATLKNNENEYSPHSKNNSSKRRSLLRKLHSGENIDCGSKVHECTGQNMMTSILDATVFSGTQNSNSVEANIFNILPSPAKEILKLEKTMVDAIDEFVTTDLKLDGFF